MPILIDGYNLMFALGMLGKPLGPDLFRRARTRFLNRLVDALGPLQAHQTTVVFDAASPPAGLPSESRHKGITVLYAVSDENADALIERLIARHAAPRGLTVVSSDHRIRQAAARRKSEALTAEAFLDRLDASRRQRASAPQPPSPEESARLNGLPPEEAKLWQEIFRDVADEPDTAEALGQGGFLPTDEEIARIEREIEDEFRR